VTNLFRMARFFRRCGAFELLLFKHNAPAAR
jgi:hypothetical protein